MSDAFQHPEEYYHYIKDLLGRKGFAVDPYKSIMYGLQFEIFLLGRRGMIRIYEGKKGLKLDLSQVKDEAFVEKINKELERPTHQLRLLDMAQKKAEAEQNKSSVSELKRPADPTDLIGVDESGKGDYFGPLVIAAVHVNEELAPRLIEMGVRDSKTLEDAQMIVMAEEIQKLCKHSLVILGNPAYNEIYATMKNLNHMLAWGHAKVIQNTLAHTPCNFALCDQFADASLVRNALNQKGIPIVVFQRPKAEDNIAVAAASIVARAHFVMELDKLSESVHMKLPKGCSDRTLSVGKKLYATQGEEILGYTAKLHFKLTQEILQSQ